MHRSSLSPIRTTRRLHATAPAAAAERTTSAAGAAPNPTIPRKTRRTLAAVGVVWLAFATTATSTLASPAEAAPALTATQQRDPLLKRGRYLVEQVGLCADCHTPRNEKGQFVTERWMMGSPLAFQPMIPMPWSAAAPQIAGLPTMTEKDALTFMKTGVRPDGSKPLPPMPEYRFDERDAAAVVAYLKSLAPSPARVTQANR